MKNITFFIVVFFYLLSFNVNEYINKATNKPRGQFNNYSGTPLIWRPPLGHKILVVQITRVQVLLYKFY